MTPSMTETHEQGFPPIVLYDRTLILAVAALLGLGLLMVASTSIVISERLYGGPFHFLIHQTIYLTLGLASAFIVYRVPLERWERHGMDFLLIALILLTLVLIHGIGHEVDGSMRW